MQNEFHQIDTCEVCGNKKLESVLDLGLHPMCDELIPLGDKSTCRLYPIEILFCRNCCTAHQKFQVPKRNLFPATYHYRSRLTADVLNGMAGLVNSCEEKFGTLRDKKVLDIGCNDGSLLDFFRQKGARTIGIEPTDAYTDAKQKGHDTINDFLSEALAESIITSHGKPDFITFTNVFAHIENLREVINSLKKLMAPSTVVVIENHYLGSVLDGNQFDTFYHEHPRSYSYTSFIHISRFLDTQLLEVEFPARYGGNIRVFLGNTKITKKSDNPMRYEELRLGESQFFKKFNLLQGNIHHWREVKRNFIMKQVKEYGKIRAKAFPGRAAILIKLLGLDEELICAVHEKPGSMKIGYYVPGTRIPIYSDDDLFNVSDTTKPILNLAWHIPDEIRKYLTLHGYTGPIIDILSPDDFLLSSKT